MWMLEHGGSYNWICSLKLKASVSSSAISSLAKWLQVILIFQCLSLFIKLSGHKWHSFHIVTYPSKESLWLVDFFKVKLISSLNLSWKIIVLFFILKLCFYCIYNFSNYFLKRFKNIVSNLINSFLKLFLPHDDKTVLFKFTGKL